MSIKLKHEIIEKHGRGVHAVDLSRQYESITSTKQELIKDITQAKGVKIISKLRTSAHKKMEMMPLVFLTEKQQARDIVTEGIICKTQTIYGELLQLTPYASMDEAYRMSFKVSQGWLDNF